MADSNIGRELSRQEIVCLLSSLFNHCYIALLVTFIRCSSFVAVYILFSWLLQNMAAQWQLADEKTCTGQSQ